MLSETVQVASDGKPPFEYTLVVETCDKCGKEIGRNMSPWYGHISSSFRDYLHKCP